MRKLLTALCVGACAAAASFGTASAATVSVQGGTPVAIHLGGPLSSSTAKAGQTFRILAAAPLVVDGVLVIKKGASGQGTIEAATPAGSSGRQGTLSIAFDWIYSAGGSKIPLAAMARHQMGKNKTGSSNAANVGATLLLGPVGLFAHNLVKGHDIDVPTSRVFRAYVGTTVTVRTRSM